MMSLCHLIVDIGSPHDAYAAARVKQEASAHAASKHGRVILIVNSNGTIDRMSNSNNNGDNNCNTILCCRWGMHGVHVGVFIGESIVSVCSLAVLPPPAQPALWPRTQTQLDGNRARGEMGAMRQGTDRRYEAEMHASVCV